MKRTRTAIATLSLILSTGASAGAMHEEETCWGRVGSCWGSPQPGTAPLLRVAALTIGPAWTSNRRTETFYLRPRIQKTYAAAREHTVLANGELFLGKCSDPHLKQPSIIQ